MRWTSVWLSCAAHVALGAGSALWLSLTRNSVLAFPQVEWLEPALPRGGEFVMHSSARSWLGLLAALLTAASTIHATRLLVQHTTWARALHVTLRGALLGARPVQLVLLSATSAWAEELFFRALLGPAVGFLLSSALFGLLHGVRRDAPLPVTLWSFGMGLIFSELYRASGTLLAPILAHGVINYENMQYICNYDPTPLDMDRLSVSGESGSEG